jgi:hypothetical protein
LDATTPVHPATKKPIAATTSARVRLEARPLNWVPPQIRMEEFKRWRVPTLEEADQNSRKTQTQPFERRTALHRLRVPHDLISDCSEFDTGQQCNRRTVLRDGPKDRIVLPRKTFRKTLRSGDVNWIRLHMQVLRQQLEGQRLTNTCRVRIRARVLMGKI